jgi:hypothetical protein
VMKASGRRASARPKITLSQASAHVFPRILRSVFPTERRQRLLDGLWSCRALVTGRIEGFYLCRDGRPLTLLVEERPRAGEAGLMIRARSKSGPRPRKVALKGRAEMLVAITTIAWRGARTLRRSFISICSLQGSALA